MKLNYDLIIITDNLAGIQTAKYALGFQGRIGLIIIDNYLEKAFRNMAIEEKSLSFLESNYQVNINNLIKEKRSLTREKYLTELQAEGVDVIFDSVEFQNTKPLTIKTNKYTLQSTAYLLAISANIHNHNYDNKSSLNYLTINDLVNKENWQNLADKLAIIGDDLIAINLAQVLTKLGKKVTIITSNRKLLLTEDEDINFSLQALLEAQGINILTNSQVTQIELINGHKWLQAGNKAIETEEIIVTNKFINYLYTPDKKDDLGLAKIGIDLSGGKIKVNFKLQSSHPQIYVFGDILGGYNLNNLAQYEGKIAVKNALFSPFYQQKVNYQNFPYSLPTYPAINCIGYTESKARKIYGDSLKIIKFRLPQQLWEKRQTNLTTLVKIICDENDCILGAHFFNLDSLEIITIISTIIQKNKNIYSLFSYPFSNNRSLEIVNHLNILWQQKYQDNKKFIFNLLETFLLWKRY